MKKLTVRLLAAALCLSVLFCLSGCGPLQALFRSFVRSRISQTLSPDDTSSDVREEYVSSYDGAQGSAGSLNGRTLMISIFTDDAETSWNSESEEDSNMIYDSLDNLRISTEYLTTQAARYGSKAEFIWDWELNPDLRYDAKFTESLVTEYGDMYEVQKDWIEQNIDIDTLKNKYRADNVIYFFFFNTDYSNQVNPWYLGYSCSPDYYVEFCNIYVRFDDVFITQPPSYAHEILHCFGAHDLYYANEFIPSNYVDHLGEIGSNDIMYTVYDSKDIGNEFTDLDAYYVGLIDHCREVDKWNLAKSEHLTSD